MPEQKERLNEYGRLRTPSVEHQTYELYESSLVISPRLGSCVVCLCSVYSTEPGVSEGINPSDDALRYSITGQMISALPA